MKTFKILYLVLVLFLTIGCSNDDNSEPLPEQLIIGDWTVADMSIIGNAIGDDMNIDWTWSFYYPFPMQATIETQQYSVNFSKSKQITSNGSLKTSYTAYFNDDENVYEYSKVLNNIDFFENGNWSIEKGSANNHFLTVSINNVIEIFPIIELSANKFMVVKHLKDNFSANPGNGYGDIGCIANLEVTLTFQKN